MMKKRLNGSYVGRIYSGCPKRRHIDAQTLLRVPRCENLVLTALFDIPTNVLERVSAQV
jgi:hypothetical protein